MAYIGETLSQPRRLPLFVCLLLCFAVVVITFYDGRWYPLHHPRPIELKNHTELPQIDYLRVQFNVSSILPKCDNDDVLLIYILSSSSNFHRRKNIRATWASKRQGTCFIFLVGNTLNGTKIQTDLDAEQEQYRDLVQINYQESYGNVIYKEVAALLWSAHHYRKIPYLFKTDDDLIVDSILISSIAQYLVTNRTETLHYISKYRPNFARELVQADRKSFFRGGWEMARQPTERGNWKFGVSNNTWPEKYLPPYCSGFGWMMSSTVRDRLVQAAQTYPTEKIIWIGDVFLSGFVARAAQVRCTSLSIDFRQVSGVNCSCLLAQNPMLTVCSSSLHGGGGVSDDPHATNEFQRSWTVIQRRHTPSNMSSSRISSTC